LSRAFAKASLPLLENLPKNEGVRLSPNPICADRAAFAAQSHRQAQLVLPAACYRRRASSARREGAARTFFGAGLPGECLRATRGLVGPQNYPRFFRPENNGAQRPIVFRWVLAPDSHAREVAPLDPTCFASSRRHSHPIS
jgi:hypothetical protein